MKLGNGILFTIDIYREKEMLVGFIAIVSTHAFSTNNMIFLQDIGLLLVSRFKFIYQHIA